MINDGSQNFLTFDSFSMPASHTETTAWKSKELSNEITKPPTTVNYSLSRKLK